MTLVFLVGKYAASQVELCRLLYQSEGQCCVM